MKVCVHGMNVKEQALHNAAFWCKCGYLSETHENCEWGLRTTSDNFDFNILLAKPSLTF